MKEQKKPLEGNQAMMIDDYALGVIWGCGTIATDDGRLIVRHRDRHYTDYVAGLTGNRVYQQDGRTGTQHVVKVSAISMQELISMGWSPRTADSRGLPGLTDYQAWARAWIELHSVLDYSTRYRRDGTRCKRLRLRIYGNHALMSGIGSVLAAGAGVGVKTVQMLHNEMTGALYYQSHSEIVAVLDWIYGVPCNAVWWQMIDNMLNTPELAAQENII